MQSWAGRSSIRSSSAPAAWARRRSTSWRGAASACWGWSSSASRTSSGPRQARRASSASPTSSIRATCRSCACRSPAGRRCERDFGETLLTVTGGLDIGLPSGRVVSGAKEACREHRPDARGAAGERGRAALSGLAVAAGVRGGVPARGRLPARGPGHRCARDASPQARRRRARERSRARLEGHRRSRRGRDGAGPLRGGLAGPGSRRVDGQAAGSVQEAGNPAAAGGWLVQDAGPAVRAGRVSGVHPRLSGDGATSTAFRSRRAKASRSASSAIAWRTSTRTRSTGA